MTEIIDLKTRQAQITDERPSLEDLHDFMDESVALAKESKHDAMIFITFEQNENGANAIINTYNLSPIDYLWYGEILKKKAFEQ